MKIEVQKQTVKAGETILRLSDADIRFLRDMADDAYLQRPRKKAYAKFYDLMHNLVKDRPAPVHCYPIPEKPTK